MKRPVLTREDRDLYARAALVRELISRGVVDPYSGLYYVVCPSPAMLEREASLTTETKSRRIERDS